MFKKPKQSTSSECRRPSDQKWRAQKLIIAPFYSLKVVIKLAGSFTILLEHKCPGKLQRVIFFYNIRRQLVKDFEQFARSMRAQYIFHGKNSDLQPLHVKSDWIPPIQPSVMLESYLEEVKISLANIQVRRPKDNVPHRERRARRILKAGLDSGLWTLDSGLWTFPPKTLPHPPKKPLYLPL